MKKSIPPLLLLVLNFSFFLPAVFLAKSKPEYKITKVASCRAIPYADLPELLQKGISPATYRVILVTAVIELAPPETIIHQSDFVAAYQESGIDNKTPCLALVQVGSWLMPSQGQEAALTIQPGAEAPALQLAFAVPLEVKEITLVHYFSDGATEKSEKFACAETGE